MEPIEIAEKIRERFPGDVIDIVSFRAQVSVVVSRDRIAEISRFVFKDPAIRMDMLSDLSDRHKSRAARPEPIALL